MKLPIMNEESLKYDPKIVSRQLLTVKKKDDINEPPFLPFNMLDPNPKLGEQVYFASHLNFGAYHGGVVCDDVSTNSDKV